MQGAGSVYAMNTETILDAVKETGLEINAKKCK
jgi:hypothetical protein